MMIPTFGNMGTLSPEQEERIRRSVSSSGAFTGPDERTSYPWPKDDPEGAIAHYNELNARQMRQTQDMQAAKERMNKNPEQVKAELATGKTEHQIYMETLADERAKTISKGETFSLRTDTGGVNWGAVALVGVGGLALVMALKG